MSTDKKDINLTEAVNKNCRATECLIQTLLGSKVDVIVHQTFHKAAHLT